MTPITLHRFPAEVWTAAVAGSTLTLQGRRRTDKAFSSPEEARTALQKAVRKKMLEGFVRRAEDGTVAQAVAPHGQSVALDISPDGALLLTAGMDRGAHAAWIIALDRRTGQWTRWLDLPPASRQNFIHQVRFTRDDRVLYLCNTDLFRLDAPGAQPEPIGSWHEWEDGFNPFCVQPELDIDRQRLLTFAAPRTLQVRSLTDDRVLFSFGLPQTREIRSVSLSPSGRTVAFYQASRGRIYHQEDALSDTTDEVCVYRVDGGDLLARIPAPEDGSDAPGDRVVCLAVTDDVLLLVPRYDHPPLRVDLQDGTARPLLGEPQAWGASYAHIGWSPGGQEAVLLGYPAEIVDAQGRMLETIAHPRRLQHVRYSADGRIVVLAGGGDLRICSRLA